MGPWFCRVYKGCTSDPIQILGDHGSTLAKVASWAFVKSTDKVGFRGFVIRLGAES